MKENYLQLLQSIQDTNRKISSLSFILSGYYRMESTSTMFSVLEKFSATIKYLNIDLTDTDINSDLSGFLKMLSLIPNAEHIRFRGLISEADRQQSHEDISNRKKRIVAPSNEILNLHRLRTLYISHTSDEFLDVFNRLPAGILTEVGIDTFDMDILAGLFKRQTSIVHLQLRGIKPEDFFDFFDDMTLQSLEWKERDFSVNGERFLSKQTKLKSLKLLDGIVEGGVMNVVANHLTELEALSIATFDGWNSYLPMEAFVNIKKLKNLKHFSLKGCEEYFESFAQLDNSRITKLDLQSCFCAINSVDLIGALAKSLPNLWFFSITSIDKHSIFNAIRRSFNFVKVLKIRGFIEDNDANNDSFQGDCVNPKLTELNISCRLQLESSEFLQKLIADYPNLVKLKIQLGTPFSSKEFQLIWNGFTKMKYLTLHQGASSELTIDDLNYLKEHKNKLKLLKLRRWKEPLTEEYQKKLRDFFDLKASVSYNIDLNDMGIEFY